MMEAGDGVGGGAHAVGFVCFEASRGGDEGEGRDGGASICASICATI